LLNGFRERGLLFFKAIRLIGVISGFAHEHVVVWTEKQYLSVVEAINF
jgi:hypothetical protein